MELKKKGRKGEPTGNIRILVGETLYKTNHLQNTRGVTIYNTTTDDFVRLLERLIPNTRKKGGTKCKK